jgi:hypothetical protein
VDEEPPVLDCPTQVMAFCSSTNGGVANFTVTATDNCDTNVEIVCTPPSGSTFALGTTIVNCAGRDDSGNTDFCSFEVVVEDNTPARLSVTRDGGNLIISWPQTCTRYVLEETGALGGNIWTPTSGMVEAVGSDFQIRIPIGPGNKFFRLRATSN